MIVKIINTVIQGLYALFCFHHQVIMQGMETVNRRTTYRLYPTPAQEAALQTQREAHRLLYNAALEQRKAAWTRQRISLGYAQQCQDLPEVRQTDATPLPAQAAQHTLKRVDRAFQAFFRRVKARRRSLAIRASSRANGARAGAIPHMGMAGACCLARACSMGGCGWLVSGMSVSVGMRGRLASRRRAISCISHGRWYASVVLAVNLSVRVAWTR